MKALIVYSSKNGSTKKIANIIHDCQTSWDIINLKETAKLNEIDLNQYDLLFIGGWIDKGTYNKECLAYAKTIKHKNIVFFFTLGAYPSSKHAFECVKTINTLFNENHNRILNHFHCQGAVDPKLINWMKDLPKDSNHGPDKHRIIRWENASKHPNQEDFDAARSCVDQTIKAFEKEKNNE